MRATEQVRWELVRQPAGPSSPPRLDADQRRVVEHRGGPLLVLAGPGTGKTTTLVEAVAARVADGLAPAQVLTLTFSRRAAGELRRRIGLRLGTTTSEPLAWTFHGFCHRLLREHGGGDLRLLSAAEADVMLRELLAGEEPTGPPAGAIAWPPSLQAAVGTAGFAEQLAGLLSRVTELGLGPPALDELGARAGRPQWRAAARLGQQLADVMALRGVTTHAELVLRAVETAEQPEVVRALRERYRVVLVDEYQDTDPLQERLLQALAGDGGELVVVGDPDQSIYGFRGARLNNILEFTDRFRTVDGSAATTIALRTCRRAGAALLAPSRALMSSQGAMPGIAPSVLRRLRALQPGRDTPPGEVSVATFPTAAAQLEAVADLLRRSHLDDGIGWDRMAVLVRSGARSLPALRRVLGTAGVPVTVAGDELPLAQEPSVQPLLAALRTADLLRDGAGPAPGELAALTTAERLTALLVSPLVGADAGDLRRLGQRLRAADSGGPGGRRMARSSDELLRAAVLDRTLLDGLDRRVAAPVRRLTGLLAAAGAVLAAADGGPEQALWVLWHDSGWAARAEAAAWRAGASGRAADRELDAVLALFQAVGQAVERRPRAGVASLLDELAAQHIPAGPTAERGAAPDAVRLLTAHRAKGLEWDVVAVVDVQDGSWPDLRARGSLLGTEEVDLAAGGGLEVVEPPDVAARLAEERRLLYVALTRARRRLLVTAVAATDETADQPSRLLADLGEPVVARTSAGRRPLTLTALVAELRRVAVDVSEAGPVRLAACGRLAMLAEARVDAARPGDGEPVRTGPDDDPLVPAADPATWWGLRPLTSASEPVRAPDEAVRLSGSALAAYQRCPLAWFLEREARAQRPQAARAGFGTVLHVLAEHLGLDVLPPELPVLAQQLDTVWQSLAFDTPWQADQEREQAHAALGRLLARLATDDRRLLGVEVGFDVTVGLDRGPEREPLLVRLTGSMDRLEVDAEGRVHVVDLKTGKSPVSGEELTVHPQLGVYQLVAGSEQLDAPGLPLAPRAVGGAELWQLRKDAAKGAPGPRVASQPPLEPGPDGTTWVEDGLLAMAEGIRAEQFPARPNDTCEKCDFRRVCPAWSTGEPVVR